MLSRKYIDVHEFVNSFTFAQKCNNKLTQCTMSCKIIKYKRPWIRFHLGTHLKGEKQ